MRKLKTVENRLCHRRRQPDDLSHERRGEQPETIGLVDVVLHHLVVEDDDAHQLGVNSEPRCEPSGAEVRCVHLCIGIEAEGDVLTDVDPQSVGDVRSHFDLADPVRIRQPALDDRDTVLIEQHPVDAPPRYRIAQPAEIGGAVLRERQDVRGKEGSDPSHTTEVGDLSSQLGRTRGVAA